MILKTGQANQVPVRVTDTSGGALKGVTMVAADVKIWKPGASEFVDADTTIAPIQSIDADEFWIVSLANTDVIAPGPYVVALVNAGATGDRFAHVSAVTPNENGIFASNPLFVAGSQTAAERNRDVADGLWNFRVKEAVSASSIKVEGRHTNWYRDGFGGQAIIFVSPSAVAGASRRITGATYDATNDDTLLTFSPSLDEAPPADAIFGVAGAPSATSS